MGGVGERVGKKKEYFMTGLFFFCIFDVGWAVGGCWCWGEEGEGKGRRESEGGLDGLNMDGRRGLLYLLLFCCVGGGKLTSTAHSRRGI